MHVSLNVFFRMIDHAMNVATAIIKTVVGFPTIGKHFRASANISLHSLVQGILIGFIDNVRSDFAVTFEQAHDRDFADTTATLNLEFAFPPGMTLCVTSAMVFDTDRAQRPPSSGI